MKLENNWQHKNLNNLEKIQESEELNNETGLIDRYFNLRKQPLNDFSIYDIRFMIIQESGLPFLLPLAINILENNILAEGNYFEGDLLSAVLKIKPESWIANRESYIKIRDLIMANLDKVANHQPKLDIANFLEVDLT